MRINLVMIVKNEERSLEKCLRAAAPFVDQIVIADTGSTDKTKDILERLQREYDNPNALHGKIQAPLSFYDFEWVNDFSAARNFALEMSDTLHHADYNLVLDADEYAKNNDLFTPEKLRDYMQEMDERYGKEWIGTIRRLDEHLTSDGVDTVMTFLPRIFPAGVRYTGIIHEQPDVDYQRVHAPFTIDHDDYMRGKKGERNLEYLRSVVEQNPEEPYFLYQMATTLRNTKHLRDSLEYFENFYKIVAKPYEIWEENEEQKTTYTGFHKDGLLSYLQALIDLGTEKDLLKAKRILFLQEKNFAKSADFYYLRGNYYTRLIRSNSQKYMSYAPAVEQSYTQCLVIGENPDEDSIIGTGSYKALFKLGTWYTQTGQRDHARVCLEGAAGMNYEPARAMLEAMGHEG